MSYYIGLSILSNDHNTGGEARRVLSLLEGKPLAEDAIAKEGQGRPFFTDREVRGRERDFSISHSRGLVAVSLVAGKNRRTGCDVELVRKRPNAQAIAEEFFSAPEKNYIISGGHFDENKFYQIWTLKECYLKLRGLSVFDMAACPSFANEKDAIIFDAVVTSPLSFYLYELSDEAGKCYILATVEETMATEGTASPEKTKQQRPEIRWFSQSFLACKSIAEIKVYSAG